jgi:thioredoxin 1
MIFDRDGMMTEDNALDAELEKIRERKRKTLADQAKEPEMQSTPKWPQGTIEISDQNFDEFVGMYPIVVVDCWAPWCGPCRMVGPVIEELARDYQGRIAFGKLNVDTNQQTAGKYGIMSIPTIFILKNGSLVDQQVGAMPRRLLEPIITKHL